jgi:hypothetical protein
MSDSVKPITPEYESTPWQPTVDTSAKDAGDEKSAAATYDSDYGGTYTTTTTSPSSGSSSTNYVELPSPTMSMAYTTAPDLIPVTNTPAPSTGGTPAPLAEPFSIQLGDLMTAEQAFLNATNATVQGYQALSSIANNAISSTTIFGQADGEAGTGDKLDSEGKSFASAVIPQIQQMLYAIGNSIEAMGQFSALLNNAGQMYTDTDAQSSFPSPQQVQADETLKSGPRLPTFDMGTGPSDGPRLPTFDMGKDLARDRRNVLRQQRHEVLG